MPSTDPARVAIVGAGPAGVAAAVQLRRQGLAADLFERGRIGGLLWHAQRVENHLGFPGGIAGPALARLLAVHLQRWEIEVRLEAVHQVEDAGGKGWRVVSDTGSAEYGHVLIATGTRPRQVDLPWSGERDQARIHRGPLVLHELEPCRVVIIGGGDAAFDYALGLGERHEVAIHHRAARPVALPLLVERVQRAGISVRQASRLSEIAATAQDLVLSFETGGVREQVRTKHLLLAIGREPELELLGPRRKEGEAGRLEREGLRLIGDVGNGIERQASISAGQGVRAAMALARRLETEQR